MKHTYETTSTGTVFTFENGVSVSNSHVTIPARDGVGPMDFPIRFHGDVFHAFRMGGASIANIPQHCRAW